MNNKFDKSLGEFSKEVNLDIDLPIIIKKTKINIPFILIRRLNYICMFLTVVYLYETDAIEKMIMLEFIPRVIFWWLYIWIPL